MLLAKFLESIGRVYRMELTEKQRWTIICGLDVAIDEYNKLATSYKSSLTLRQMQQFADQAKDAREVRDYIEDAG
jgi:hypothetical protein